MKEMEKSNSDLKTFEKEHQEIMKGYVNPNPQYSQITQWEKSSDFFVKFSLINEIPNSISSSQTLMVINS